MLAIIALLVSAALGHNADFTLQRRCLDSVNEVRLPPSKEAYCLGEDRALVVLNDPRNSGLPGTASIEDGDVGFVLSFIGPQGGSEFLTEATVIRRNVPRDSLGSIMEELRTRYGLGQHNESCFLTVFILKQCVAGDAVNKSGVTIRTTIGWLDPTDGKGDTLKVSVVLQRVHASAE